MSKILIGILVVIVAAILILYLAYTFWGAAEEEGGGLKAENLVFAPHKFLADKVLVKQEVFSDHG